MSSKRSRGSESPRERIAAQIVAAGEGHITVVEAMKKAKIPTPERKNLTKQKRVYRNAKKLVVVHESDIAPVDDDSLEGLVARMPRMPSAVDHGGSNSVSSLSGSSDMPSTGGTTVPSVAGVDSIDDVRRNLMLDDAEDGDGDALTVDTSTTIKRRRTTKQKHQAEAEKRKIEKKESQAIKMATIRINNMKDMSPSNPKKKSQAQVVRQVNGAMHTNISRKTVSRMVREGRIGVSPMKRGPVGDFQKHIWNAMKGAFVSFIKLEQAESKRQSTMTDLAKRVNAMVNMAGHNKIGTTTATKLKNATADQFELDNQNFQEHRRLQWTSHANLKAWFTQWKDTLIHLGFAREKKPDGSDDHVEGEVVFFSGQKKRVVNFDETDGSMDSTTGQRGGRKAMVFYAPEMGGGGTAANKSSYKATIICGSNADGEALPPHFQLKQGPRMKAERRLVSSS